MALQRFKNIVNLKLGKIFPGDFMMLINPNRALPIIDRIFFYCKNAIFHDGNSSEKFSKILKFYGTIII